jgi:hypothetical protein
MKMCKLLSTITRWCIPALLPVVLLLSCSGSSPVAGGGTGVGNGVVSGMVSYRDGSPAAGIPVHVRPAFYVQDTTGAPASPREGLIVDCTTDSSGVFQVDSLTSGSYSIEISALDSNTGTLYRCNIQDTETVALENRILEPLTTLSGAIKLSGLPEYGWVQIYGIEALGKIDGNGDFTIDHLPIGDCSHHECEYKLRILIDSSGVVVAKDYELELEWDSSGTLVEIELEAEDLHDD